MKAVVSWLHIVSLCCLCICLSGFNANPRMRGSYVKEASPFVAHFADILELDIGDEFPFHDFIVSHSGRLSAESSNASNVVNLFWQYEHTIRRSSSDDSLCIWPGDSDTSCYAIYFSPEASFTPYDIVVEYSQSNVLMIKDSNMYSPQFIAKILYIPPMPYLYMPPLNMPSATRDIDCLAIYSASSMVKGMRREAILRSLHEASVPVTLYSRSADLDDVEGILSQSKIVLNTHQTDNFHTLAEFRVLPALLKGCIVISELSPMTHVVPYHEYIIFANTSDLARTIIDVQENYEHYYHLIHGPDSGLAEVFQNMRTQAAVDTSAALLRALCNKENSSLAASFSGCDDFLFH